MLATIASITQMAGFRRTVKGNQDLIQRILDDLFLKHPQVDLVCLPEAFAVKGVSAADVAEIAESLSGPTIEGLARQARQHHCHMVVPLYLQRDSGIFNSAVILGRNGSVIAVYDKLHPCASLPDYTVLENGIIPGKCLERIDLDIGPVGIQICMDMNFPESWRDLAELGCKMILWPGAVPGGYLLNALARLHQCFIVAAVRSGSARIIGPCGRTISQSSDDRPFAIAKISLDFLMVSYEFNAGVPAAIEQKYGSQVRLTHFPDEGVFLLESTNDGLRLAQVQAEVGFETLPEHLNRLRNAYGCHRSGINPNPQPARHGNRSQ